MTLPYQRTNSVARAREFLLRLSSPYGEDGIKGIKKEVRQEARDILRHFPLRCELGRDGMFVSLDTPVQPGHGQD